MMAVPTGQRVRPVIFLLLLTIVPSSALASDCSNFAGFKGQARSERRLAASPDSAIPGHVPAPSPTPTTPRLPPSPPPNTRPAVISPSSNTPGADLPPKLRTPPAAASAAPTTSPPASPSKQSNVAVILGVTVGVLVLLLVSLSAAAYFKPGWLPCCGRRHPLTQYERHVPI